jgi:amidase
MATPNSDFSFATASELIAAMDGKLVSSLELTAAAIDRIERWDPMLNALCARDFEGALAAARRADAMRARGEAGPLSGVPLTVKESFNIAGLPTTWGIPPFKDFVPQEDALAVARLKAAGAVVLGKTNVPTALGDLQTYNPIYGTTNNPWDPTRTPGGSSGGSAAALAAGFGALSIGSDIAGSLRVPAHFCGVFAHKPTFGLLPGRGHTLPMAPAIPVDRDLTVIGPMARSATDLELLVNVLADPDPNTIGKAYRLALPPPRATTLAEHRVLMIDDHPLIPTSLAVRRALVQVAAGLARAGARVRRESADLPDLIDSAGIYMRLLMASMAGSLPPDVYQRMKASAAAIPSEATGLAAERARGAVMDHRDWQLVDARRAVLREQWRSLFAAFDVVICPAAPTPAFHHDHSPDPWSRTLTIDGGAYNYADQLVWAGLASAPGLPATAMPVGFSDEGLPIGVQVLGPMYEDRTPLRFAALYEQAFGGFVPPSLATTLVEKPVASA